MKLIIFSFKIVHTLVDRQSTKHNAETLVDYEPWAAHINCCKKRKQLGNSPPTIQTGFHEKFM